MSGTCACSGGGAYSGGEACSGEELGGVAGALHGHAELAEVGVGLVAVRRWDPAQLAQVGV